jgi:aryl-alcohol dehydrogenase-like predicted oxidoreductase
VSHAAPSRQLRLAVAPIGLNAASFTTGCGAVDSVEAAAIVSQLRDTAAALIDATDLTGSGDVETLVGRAVRGHRDAVVLASRGGARYTVHGRLTAVDARPANMATACDTTLRRLGTDHIDLYYLDRVDPRVPLEDSMGAMAALVSAGKVRHIGVSHVDAAQLRRAHAVHEVTVVSAAYSLLDRRAEEEILPTARALGVGLAAYRPLGGGLLTGSFAAPHHLADNDYRRTDEWFGPENLARLTHAAEGGRADRDPAASEPGPVGARLVAGPGRRHRRRGRHPQSDPPRDEPRRGRGPARSGRSGPAADTAPTDARRGPPRRDYT